jgi:hypothetical protein
MPNCENDYFSGCEYSKRLINKILSVFKVKLFIETGTYLGNTTEFIASNYPDMKILTIEINDKYYNISSNKLSKYSNINCINGDSSKMLNDIDIDHSLIKLYYLDAHWYNHNPIRDELKSIFKNSKDNEIIIIDDFKVPNRDLGYDVPLDINYINDLLDTNKWTYFFKDKGENYDTRATGQIYIFNKNLGTNLINSFIKYENNIPYSSI